MALGVALISISFADTFEKVYADWQTEYQKLSQAGKINSQENMTASMDSFVGKIEFAKMTALSMESIADSPFMGHPKVEKPATDWLAGFKS